MCAINHSKKNIHSPAASVGNQVGNQMKSGGKPTNTTPQTREAWEVFTKLQRVFLAVSKERAGFGQDQTHPRHSTHSRQPVPCPSWLALTLSALNCWQVRACVPYWDGRRNECHGPGVKTQRSRCFLFLGIPKKRCVLKWSKLVYFWMNWGYHHFRKAPYVIAKFATDM